MYEISIHAPLAGCDIRIAFAVSSSVVLFQSTHPSRGATGNLSPEERAPFISIHAPLAGCDYTEPQYTISASYFNPRTPRGVRRSPRYSLSVSAKSFQSTHPSRGATASANEAEKAALQFQSTHPSRGATHPFYGGLNISATISIHAPLAGCDSNGI